MRSAWCCWSRFTESLEICDTSVAEVERVLCRKRGIRIGEAPDRDGRYFHYLAMWLYALGRLREIRPEYRVRAIALLRAMLIPPSSFRMWA